MMDLTPLEVRKKKDDFRRQIRGYEPGQVDDFLDLVADRLEQLVRENATLGESTGRLEQQVGEYREREKALTEALVSAQQMREDMRIQATRDADQARTQAASDAERSRSEAREVLAKAKEEAARQLAEARQKAEQELAAAHDQAIREVTEAKAQAEAEAIRILGDARELRQREESLLRDLRTRRAGLLETYGSLLQREIADLQGLRQATETVEPDTATEAVVSAGSALDSDTPEEEIAAPAVLAEAAVAGVTITEPEAAVAEPIAEAVGEPVTELLGDSVVELEFDDAVGTTGPEPVIPADSRGETWLAAVDETYEQAEVATGVAPQSEPEDSDDDFLADLLLEDADEDAIAAIILAEDAEASGGVEAGEGSAVPAASLEDVPGPPVADPSSDEEWLESLLEEVGVAPVMGGAAPPARQTNEAAPASEVVEELLLSDDDLPLAIGEAAADPAEAPSEPPPVPAGAVEATPVIEAAADQSSLAAASSRPEPGLDSGSDEMELLLARADAEMRAAEAAAGLGDLTPGTAAGASVDDGDDDIGIDAMFRDEDDDLRDFDFDAALVNATGMPAAPEGTDPLTFTNIPADDRARAPARPFGVALVSDDALEDRGFDRNEFGMPPAPSIPPAPNGHSHAAEDEPTDPVSVERQRPNDSDDDIFATLFGGR